MHRTNRTLFGRLFPAGPARRDDTAGRDPDNGGPTSKPEDSGTGDQGDADKTPHITGDFDPDRAARTIAAARVSEKTAKAAAKSAQERLAAVLKAAGLTPDGKQDPAEQLRDALAERDKASTAARESAVGLAVYQAAGALGASAKDLLDSRTFLTSIADLDPSADGFDAKIREAIKTALKANPRLAAAPASQASKQGADHTGGGTSRTRSKNIDEAVRRKLGG